MLEDLEVTAQRMAQTYTVQKGDSGARIGQQLFGDERAGVALLLRNGIDPSTLQPGQVLDLTGAPFSAADLRQGGALIAADAATRASAADAPIAGTFAGDLRIAQSEGISMDLLLAARTGPSPAYAAALGLPVDASQHDTVASNTDLTGGRSFVPWDGRMPRQVSDAQRLFEGTLQGHVAQSLPGDFLALVTPELVAPKVAAALAFTGERLFGVAARGWADVSLAPELGLFDAARGGVRLEFQPSSGVLLEATPGRTTTILGNYRQDMRGIIDELGNVKSLDFGARPGGFNVLNVSDDLSVSPKQFWTEYNQPWLENALARNDVFLMATQPQFGSNSFLFRANETTRKLELSGFGREYLQMRRSGYVLDPVTKQMVRQ